MKRLLIAPVMAFALAGCEAVRTVAPTTVAAYENEGLLSAVDTFSQHFEIKCGEIDGAAVAIDVTAEVFEAADTVEKARERRKRICDRFIAANMLRNLILADPDPVEGELSPLPVAKPVEG